MSPNKQNQDIATTPAFVSAVDRGVGGTFRVANVWAHGAGFVFERSGNFIAGLLDALGHILRRIPVVGKVLYGMFHWLATIISAGFDLAAMLIGSFLSLLIYGLGGIVRILTGLLEAVISRDSWLIRKGAVDILSGMAGTVIAVVAKLVALIQATIFMQMGERPLNEHEKAIVQRVYRDSMAVQNIRIIEGFAGLFSTNDRPFALGNRIYLKHIDSMKDPALFAHECCHIWQYQRDGVRYIIEALWAQWKVENAYSWEAEIARGHLRWQEFNREAQAQFVQDVFNGGRRNPASQAPGEFYDDNPISDNVEYKRKGMDYTDLARSTIALIRNKGVPG